MHTTDERHDTPCNRAPTEPAGKGTRTSCQVAPFHVSAKGRPAAASPLGVKPDPGDSRAEPALDAEFANPTAIQAFAAVHDTPVNPLPPAAPLSRFGVSITDQAFPFQISAKVKSFCPFLA